jgi:hypothetical protein
MFNNTPWLEEQLNKDYRREAERHAEQERASHTEGKQTAWQWLQDRMR